MRILFFAALLLMTSGASAQGMAGDWSGTLDTPRGSVALILHVSPEASGGFAASVDSPDQGVEGLNAEIAASGDTVTVTIPLVGARYVAIQAGDELAGTFSQGGADFPLTLRRLAAGESPAMAAPEAALEPSAAMATLVGDWVGLLGGSLGLVLHLKPGVHPDTLSATLDSPDQNSFGIPTEGAWIEGDALYVGISAVSGSYTADIRGDSLVGTWTQGQSFPLTLVRVEGPTGARGQAVPPRPNRPQTPEAPFPYRVEDLSVESASGVTLAGTLTLPDGDGPFPAVVLVSGSGPQDRDSNIAGHRPFAVWADHLTRAGIAVYRFDDRGTAGSTGDRASATIPDFAADAVASVRTLAARPDIGTVGIVGHSEGGYVAPLAARLSPEVGFVVMLAGPGVPGREVYIEQQRLIALAQGVPPEVADLYSENVAALISPFSGPSDLPLAERRAEGERAARAVLNAAPEATYDALMQGQPPEGVLTSLLDFVSTPGIGSFLAFDPAPEIEALAVPALAVFGGVDVQVSPEQSVAPMEAALEASRSPSHDVHVFDGLNHLFQPSETGWVGEYADIPVTVSEDVLTYVTRWISEAAR